MLKRYDLRRELSNVALEAMSVLLPSILQQDAESAFRELTHSKAYTRSGEFDLSTIFKINHIAVNRSINFRIYDTSQRPIDFLLEAAKVPGNDVGFCEDNVFKELMDSVKSVADGTWCERPELCCIYLEVVHTLLKKSADFQSLFWGKKGHLDLVKAAKTLVPSVAYGYDPTMRHSQQQQKANEEQTLALVLACLVGSVRGRESAEAKQVAEEVVPLLLKYGLSGRKQNVFWRRFMKRCYNFMYDLYQAHASNVPKLLMDTNAFVSFMVNHLYWETRPFLLLDPKTQQFQIPEQVNKTWNKDSNRMVSAILRIVNILSMSPEGRSCLTSSKFTVALLDSVARSSSCQEIVEVAQEALEHHKRESNVSMCCETQYQAVNRRLRSTLTLQRKFNNEVQAYYVNSVPAMMRALKGAIEKQGNVSLGSLVRLTEERENSSSLSNLIPVPPEIIQQRKEARKAFKVTSVLQLLKSMMSDGQVVKEVEAHGGEDLLNQVGRQFTGEARLLANQCLEEIQSQRVTKSGFSFRTQI
eukprot:TRINITY_DN7446_c0_g1_i4.p1 TRINITY_DN7446_c0_g1~~TRINITY_DN7446_c0_g1_i4.p1  ORF type:complete len:606 (-),score=94.00 TRINITY_DN7446_c0_g1_i4:986-2569(-)